MNAITYYRVCLGRVDDNILFDYSAHATQSMHQGENRYAITRWKLFDAPEKIPNGSSRRILHQCKRCRLSTENNTVVSRLVRI